MGTVQNLLPNYRSELKKKKVRKNSKDAKNFDDNLRSLLTFITLSSQGGCLIFIIFLLRKEIIVIFYEPRPRKGITASYMGWKKINRVIG